jgi:hypothetical protein
MRTFPRQQIKAAAVSMGIGVAVFGVIAYAMLLFSVTQSAALKSQPPAAMVR